MEMDNLILIGMPGVGKSTVGVILAKVLGYQFIDSDLVIQERKKRLLHEIISAEGVQGFIEIENQINASLQVHRAVIATGGSAVYGKEAMANFKSIGKIIYLKLSYEQIEERLSDIKGRGVALRDGQTLKDLYEERTMLYDKYADIIINEENLTVEETITTIIEAINI
ncbi:shikimate kinase [Lachnotalea glycerini]|uniref:Shikimate kinase n=2 Tax=Lachnotalea glycerini TaxID=1763509 RepID=A0A371JEU7_9FIRM|nr:shikimate kinase [Lachnotalea glycerini]